MKSWKDGRIHKKDFYLITISSDCIMENRQWIFGKEKYVMVNVYMFKNMHDVLFEFQYITHIPGTFVWDLQHYKQAVSISDLY